MNDTFVIQLGLADTDRMPLILSNHDSFAGDRVWNQLAGDAGAYKLAAASYLLTSATPFTYYGEEVGMAGDNITGQVECNNYCAIQCRMSHTPGKKKINGNDNQVQTGIIARVEPAEIDCHQDDNAGNVE